MLHVALFEPEIPPNTGNIIRLCANSGAHLHLIHPLGFELDDKKLRRAGLDYREWAQVQQHANLNALKSQLPNSRLLPCSTRATTRHDQMHYQPGDILLFGPETRGLPQALLDELPAEQCLRIPMRPNNRSLNLSNAVAIVLYEAWRQMDFVGGA